MDKNDINNTESTLPGTLRGAIEAVVLIVDTPITCLLYTSPSPRDS